ncbi:hypothetical protein ACHAWF_008489 [Thalassiosira exigua]
MPKPKDAKVWNEDLIAALDARHQKSLREGKRDAHTWQKGRGQIEAVRSDIYQFGTGRIVNLPAGLSKTVQRTCEDIVRGVKAVYPDGHVPTNSGHAPTNGGGSPTAPSGRASNVRQPSQHRRMDDGDFGENDYGNARPRNNNTSYSSDNPFNNDHYMNKIKIRGGAFAILMAFHYSQTDVLRKAQICKEAQKFCDEAMEANYMAGRPRGAWSGNKTLQDHHLLTERNFRTFGSGGFRDRPHEYTLTRDGKLFVEALFANRPGAVAAASNAAGDPFQPSFARGAASFRDQFGSPSTPQYSPTRTISSSAPPASRNSARDVADLESWWPSATVGERKTFNVGKERRKYIHRRVDSLMAENPGLIMTHNSSKEGRQRELIIQLVSKPEACHSLPLNRKRPLLCNSSDDFPGYGQSLSLPSIKRVRAMNSRDNAAAAAMRRLKQVRGEAKKDEDLKMAIAESKKLAKKTSSRLVDIVEIGSEEDNDEQLQKALKESLLQSASKKKSDSCLSIDLSPDSDDEMLKPVFSTGRAGPKHWRQINSAPSLKAKRNSIAKSSDDDDDGVIEIFERKEAPKRFIDLLNDCELDMSGTNDDNEAGRVVDGWQTTAGIINHELVVLIDNRERNRNATPRTLRIELERHLSSSGPISAIWPPGVSCKVEEARLDYGDFAFEYIQANSGERRRIGVSVERKRVNDLVQRSYRGDHLSQLWNMQQKSSMAAILLIEYDTRIAGSVTAYGAQNRDNSDPFDTTITCENEIFRLLGRLVLSSENFKFIQTRDEQCSLRAIGALSLMSLASLEDKKEDLNIPSNKSGDTQSLFDTLKNGGIPWRLANRVESIFGSIAQLRNLYQSCSNAGIKSRLLAPMMAVNDEAAFEGLSSTPEGWADAAYRIAQNSDLSENTTTNQLSGEGALLLHRELVEDHGVYLSYFHQGMTPEEALDRALDGSYDITTSPSINQQRYVFISLTQDQQSRYFEMPAGDKAFYKLAITSRQESAEISSAITMQTRCGSLVSKMLHVFEFEGSVLMDMIEEMWRNNRTESNFVKLAQLLAKCIDAKCKCQSRCAAGNSKIVLVCGLQAALDSHAKNAGYRVETKAVLDMAFADMMLGYDLTIIQALRKKVEDRLSVVKQLAMACFHFGFTTTEVFD